MQHLSDTSTLNKSDIQSMAAQATIDDDEEEHHTDADDEEEHHTGADEEDCEEHCDTENSSTTLSDGSGTS